MIAITEWKCPSVLGATRQVPLLDGRKVPQVFLDNAASTKPFRSVGEFLIEIQPYYSNIHRGTGFDSMFCNNQYELARRIVGEFVGYDPDLDVVIPVRNTTEGMNLLSNTIPLALGDQVLTTLSEHHSNDLPWRDKAIVEHLPVTVDGHLDLQLLENRLISANGKVRVVSVTGASNVLGTVLPIHEIAAISHRYGALIVVDGAQLVPHRQVQMLPHTDLSHIDFLVFSGHKMNCPYGVGVVIGQRAIFDATVPYQPGGGTVYSVNTREVQNKRNIMVGEIQQGDWRNVPGAVRASLGIHNTEQDITTLIKAVTCIAYKQWQGVYEQDRATGEFSPQGFQFNFSTLPNLHNETQYHEQKYEQKSSSSTAFKRIRSVTYSTSDESLCQSSE